MLFHCKCQHIISIPDKVFLIPVFRVPTQEADQRIKNSAVSLQHADSKVLLEIPNDYVHYNSSKSLRCM